MTMTLFNSYPRETVEPVRFAPVIIDGDLVTDFEWQLVREHERPDPAEWDDVIDDNGPAFMLPGNLPRGMYLVFIRAGTVVAEAGRVDLT